MPTIGGAPDKANASALTSAVVLAANIPIVQGYFSVDLPDIAVTVGQVLALVAQGDAFIPVTVAGTYSGGQRYCRGPLCGPSATWLPLTGQDLGFRTFVDTSAVAAPAPTTLALLGLGITALALRRGRRTGVMREA